MCDFFQQRKGKVLAAGRRPGRWLWQRPGIHPEKVGVQMGVGVAYKWDVCWSELLKKWSESWKIISPKDFRQQTYH